MYCDSSARCYVILAVNRKKNLYFKATVGIISVIIERVRLVYTAWWMNKAVYCRQDPQVTWRIWFSITLIYNNTKAEEWNDFYHDIPAHVFGQFR